jgi:pimeloyl-ACP methyl ester carboxylesterase
VNEPNPPPGSLSRLPDDPALACYLQLNKAGPLKILNSRLKYMLVKMGLAGLGIAIDSMMTFVPQSRYEPRVRKLTTQETKTGPIRDGWELRERRSPVSGILHRYHYHPGPGPHAPAFLMLHGLILDGRNFMRMTPLGATYQLIAYDFPESGPMYRGDMNDFRYLLDDFLDMLKIDTFFLCGVSFGGGVAMRYAASHPRRIRALVLISTFVMNATPIDRLRSRSMASVILKHPDYRIYWLMEKALTLSFRGSRNPMRAAKDLVRIKHIDWYRQVFGSIPTCEGPEDAMMIKCPVLALHGNADRTISLRTGRSIGRHIPHARFEVIDGGTHAMSYLQGKEIAERIGAFLVNRV